MIGLEQSNASSASLLLNLEGVLTALIAVFVFRENSDRWMWVALIFMTMGAILLSYNPRMADFDPWTVMLIALAMLCWAIDNNITRGISDKDPVTIGMVKGLVAGGTVFSLAIILHDAVANAEQAILGLTVGAFCYGLSLVLFITALMYMGSCRTGAFFSVGPFIGAISYMSTCMIIRTSIIVMVQTQQRCIAMNISIPRRPTFTFIGLMSVTDMNIEAFTCPRKGRSSA